jgi:hypothetical protein
MGYGDFRSLDPGVRHQVEEEAEEAIERWAEGELEAAMTNRKMPLDDDLQKLLKEYGEVEEAILDIRDKGHTDK